MGWPIRPHALREFSFHPSKKKAALNIAYAKEVSSFSLPFPSLVLHRMATCKLVSTRRWVYLSISLLFSISS